MIRCPPSFQSLNMGQGLIFNGVESIDKKYNKDYVHTVAFLSIYFEKKQKIQVAKRSFLKYFPLNDYLNMICGCDQFSRVKKFAASLRVICIIAKQDARQENPTGIACPSLTFILLLRSRLTLCTTCEVSVGHLDSFLRSFHSMSPPGFTFAPSPYVEPFRSLGESSQCVRLSAFKDITRMITPPQAPNPPLPLPPHLALTHD